jgi:anaerobic selenocysteine-containing dehydrogenase
MEQAMTQTLDPETIVRTTCPRDCYDACGIRVVKRGETVLRVMGDPLHFHSRGTLCGKCTLAYNGAWRDPVARLQHPMRRTGPKGTGAFTPISWDDALAEIAGRLEPIVAESGGASVIQTHYTGTFSMIGYGFPLRFFNRLGATEVDPDTVCNKAGHAVLNLMYGSSMDGFDPRTARDAACILVWGANPSASAPHAHRYWLAEAAGTVIVVDPIKHPTAEAADRHLQPFPGSDAALAFAMLNVLVTEGLVDDAFVAAHTTGWDEVRPLVDACTPARGEQVTGVPADLIREAARIYGRGPSLLWLGQGLQRQATGGNVFRACSLLPAVTGNVGKPGTGFLYLNGTASRGIADEYMPAPHLNRGPARSISHMDLAACLEDPDRSRALFCWNNNIVASCPQQGRLRRALTRDDLFTVAIDLFATDTVDYADIVLPAASFLEFDDLVVSYFNYTVSPQVRAMAPIGESLPNQEIFRRLATAMGFTEPELFESDESMLGELLRQTGLGLDFAGLKQAGTVPIAPDPVVPFADLAFPTPSGRIDLAGQQFVAAGMPSAPQPWADARPAHGRLRLLSPASPWRMNSSYDNVEKARKQAGPPDVLLHPREACSRGLADGDTVVLANDAGRLAVTVVCSDTVPPGVALVHKGRWPKLDPGAANVNVLNPGQKTDIGESSAVHSVEVEILASTA